MKKVKTIFGLIFPVVLVASCSYVDQPYINPPVDPSACPAPVFPENTNQQRNVLFEEFTGHTCGNCPGGAYDIRTIYEPQYGDSLVVVSVHAGGFALVELPGYPTNFSTPAGEAYNNFFGVSGYPVGMINRVPYSSNVLIGKANWANALAIEVAKPLEINLQMITDFDSTSNKLCVHVESEFEVAKTGQYNLIVYLVEDSIVAPQKNYPGSGDPTYNIPTEYNYMHRHVLRANINGTWGNNVVDGSANAGDKFVNSIQYMVNPAWNKHRLHIVAYIYDNATKEVLQVIEEHLLH